MARDENPPFERGESWYAGGNIDTANLGAENIIGKEWVFEDRQPDAPTERTNRKVVCRAVRNTSGMNLLPKRSVSFSTTEGEYGKNVDGYADVTAEESYPVDEYLPAAGVPDDDVFWIVVEGPAVCSTSLAGGGPAAIGVGEHVVAATAATSGATTAGRVGVADFTGATEPLANQINNRIGRALTARTAGNTGNDILVDVGKW